MNVDDPRCPECGEPIGMTSAYCMHCSADLTEDPSQADAGDDGDWTDTSRPSTQQAPAPSENAATSDEPLLDPEGLVDNSLTVVVGIIGGFVIGFIELFVGTALLSVGIGFAIGILVWLGVTTYLVRLRTVQAAISKAAYGIAIAIMPFSLIVFSSAWESSSVGTRITEFSIVLVFCVVPAAIIAGVGFLVGRFVPEHSLE